MILEKFKLCNKKINSKHLIYQIQFENFTKDLKIFVKFNS
jgi:hypothetical protein